MTHRFARRAGAVLIAVAGLLAATPAHAATAPAGYKPFAPDSIWNLPVRADRALDARSAAYSTWLAGQVAAKGAYIDTTVCAMPVYWADAATPTVRVKLAASAYQDPALLRAWAAVPIPAGATPANCMDKNLAVIQRQPDGRYREWEFWAASKQADGTWMAYWGGAADDLATDSGIASDHAWSDPTAPTAWAGVSRPGWNVTASSISMIAGVITRRDAEQGRIDHALSVALPDAAKDRWVWPAQRTDGGSTSPDAIPEGAQLRLDPNLDLSKLTMLPLIRMMAEAAQKYGIVVRDKTYNNTAFYTEEVRPGESNPFSVLLAGKYPDQALKAFPWASLQVLGSSSCTVWSKCSTTEAIAIDLAAGSSAAIVGRPLTLDTSNSRLNQPRTRVEWDLDGDGAYETPAGAAVKLTYTPVRAGTQTVRVRVTTRGGAVVPGQRTLAVAAAPAPVVAPPAPAPAAPAPPAPAPAAPAPPPASSPTPPLGGSAPAVKPRPAAAKHRRASKHRKARAAAKHKRSKHRKLRRKRSHAVSRGR